MGHMNVAAYMENFDHATWNFMADQGLSRSYLADNGIGLAAVSQNITYQRELRPGDIMTIRSQLIELAGKKVRFRQVMVNGETGEVSAEIEQLAVCIDTALRKSRPFPDEIITRARQYLAEAAP